MCQRRQLLYLWSNKLLINFHLRGLCVMVSLCFVSCPGLNTIFMEIVRYYYFLFCLCFFCLFVFLLVCCCSCVCCLFYLFLLNQTALHTETVAEKVYHQNWLWPKINILPYNPWSRCKSSALTAAGICQGFLTMCSSLLQLRLILRLLFVDYIPSNYTKNAPLHTCPVRVSWIRSPSGQVRLLYQPVAKANIILRLSW